MIVRGWLGFVMICASALPLHGQVILEVESRDHRVSPPRTETSYVVCDGRQLAMGVTRGTTNADGGMIYHGGRREMVVVNHRDQNYMVLDQQAIDSLSGQINQAMGQMQETLKHLTPEQQAMMKNQMPTSSPIQRSPAEVRRTRDSATVFGYPATRYEVWRDGRKQREMWVTDWRNIGGSREVAELFVEMGGFLEGLTSSLPGGNSGSAQGLDESIFTVMSRVEGFPVGVRDYRPDGTIERESALRSAKQQRVEPRMFEPPAGYRPQEMFGGTRRGS